MSIPRLSVSNPVFANLVMLIIIVFGVYAWFSLPRDLTPEIKLQTATVTTFYPGASPEEVEKLVTAPIEDAIEEGVGKIDLMLSSSSEGRSSISIQFEEISERELDKQIQNVRTAVGRVSDLPQEILDDPEVLELDISSGFPMLTIAVGGSISEPQMKAIAEELSDDILDIKNIANVRLAGVREREVWIEADPDRLEAFGLPISEVAAAVKAHNLNLPAGSIETGGSEYLVRTMGEFTSVSEIENTIIRARQAGAPVRVRDVANVSDTYEKARTLSHINGQTSMSLTVQKKKEGNTIGLVKQVRELVQKRRSELPEGTELHVVNDYSVILKERLGILQNNTGLGLALVVVLLWFFIGWRNALFAALGIPVAFMATFVFLYLTDATINSVALFGLILVVGVVVDDAIIVIENVFRHIQEGKSPRVAAVRGAEEVGAPVLSASLTTIAAFGPLLFMSGVPGQFMRVVPTVAILVLVASLLEVFLILPSHIAEWSPSRYREPRRNRWFVQLRRRYIGMLKRILRHRYIVVTAVMVLGIVVCVAAFILLDKELFPGEDFPQFYIKLEMPTTSSLQETSAVMAHVEELALSLPKEDYVAVVTNVGFITPTSSTENARVGSNVGEVLVELTPKDQRSRGVEEIISELRPKLALISGVERLTFDKLEGGPPQGGDVEVKIKGKEFPQLEELADLLKQELRKMEGVYEIQDDFQLGKSELRIRIKEEKAHQYGLNVALIAQNVRHALEGNTATSYRDADESIDVVVKYDAQALSTPQHLSDLLIPTPMGIIVPLRDVAEVYEERGYSSIQRFENERAITVSASVDRRKTTPFKVNQALAQAFGDVETMFPGYRLDFRGVFDQTNEAFAELWKLFVVGILMLYAILGTQFKSFAQPIIILFAVPFGIIGAMVGLLAVGGTLSMVAMFGIVALSGIVVNDSIVLIDFINKYQLRGYGRWRAILKGGSVRLRPIILTTVTTVSGLVPMAIGLGGRSPIWMPLASTMIFGLTTATFLTLFVMPALYAIVGDVRARMARHETTAMRPLDEALAAANDD